MATADNMNFLVQRNDDRINAAIPKAMRKLVREICARKNMTESMYMKLALNNQLLRDIE